MYTYIHVCIYIYIYIHRCETVTITAAISARATFASAPVLALVRSVLIIPICIISIEGLKSQAMAYVHFNFNNMPFESPNLPGAGPTCPD